MLQWNSLKANRAVRAFQVGENYYHPMTTYLDAKYTDISAKIDTPGALSFRYNCTIICLSYHLVTIYHLIYQ